MDIIKSVREDQVDSVTGAARALVEAMVRLSNEPGPINLQAGLDDRVEIQCLLRKVKERMKFDNFRFLIEPEELRHRLDDGQSGPILYVPGDSTPATLQRQVIKKVREERRSNFLRPTFVFLTVAPIDELRKQGMLRQDFAHLFEGRRLGIPGPSQRPNEELKNLFRVCLERAAVKEDVRYRLDHKTLELLTKKWRIHPPPSLRMMVGIARKMIADAKKERLGMATDIALSEPLLISPRLVIDSYMSDSELATSSSTMLH